LLVAAAGLVPVVQKNRPFWGLYGTSIDSGPPRINEVEHDSPAQAAGLRVGDVILAVNGTAVDLGGLDAVLEGLKPGETATLRVQRGNAERAVTVRGVEPPVAMIYYQTPWHPVAGGVALALGLVIFATQPLRPAPRWRAVLVALAGFGLAVIFFLAVAHDNPFAYWQLRRYHTLNWGEKLGFGQNWVGLAASLALAAFAAWELRSLWRRGPVPERGGTAEPPQPPSTDITAVPEFKAVVARAGTRGPTIPPVPPAVQSD
jgi:membrane-associated protease RseP (regulator of RpoE activity)